MRQVRLIPMLAFAIAAALALSACGGDDSSEVPIVIPTETTSTTGSLDRTEFIEEADALCAEANAQIGEFVANGEGFTAAGEIADIRESLAADIRDLGEPSEDGQTLNAYLTALEAQAEAGQKIDLANQRGEDTAEFETELDNARAEAETAAADYGFEECGTTPTGSATDSAGTDGSGAVAPSDGSVAPVTPAPSTGGTGDTGGGTGDTGGDSGGGVSPGGGGISP